MDRSTDIVLKLETLRNLPTLPVVLEKARAAIQDPKSDARRLARIIEDDPAMMARILKVVNSALYGGREPINSLELAVARLGLTAVNNIALTTAVFMAYKKTGQQDFDREEFWRHCISTGIVMVVLYDRCKTHFSKRYTKDVFHLVGLLHDIGKVILEQFFHTDFMKAIELSQAKAIPLHKAEMEVLGADHCRTGAWLGKKWNLSREVIQAIRWHHEPANAEEEFRELTMLCHSANYICNLQKIGNGGDLTAPFLLQDAWTKLGLTIFDVADIVETVQEESKKSEILLSLLG